MTICGKLSPKSTEHVVQRSRVRLPTVSTPSCQDRYYRVTSQRPIHSPPVNLHQVTIANTRQVPFDISMRSPNLPTLIILYAAKAVPLLDVSETRSIPRSSVMATISQGPSQDPSTVHHVPILNCDFRQAAHTNTHLRFAHFLPSHRDAPPHDGSTSGVPCYAAQPLVTRDRRGLVGKLADLCRRLANGGVRLASMTW